MHVHAMSELLSEDGGCWSGEKGSRVRNAQTSNRQMVQSTANHDRANAAIGDTFEPTLHPRLLNDGKPG
jgi:hypothetical protein